MDVQLPDGRILKGVPDGTTKAQIAQKLKAGGFDVPAGWMQPQDQQPFPDTYGGAGGYNPMLARLGGAASDVSSSLGVTPENSSNPIANAVGPIEALMNTGSGMFANAAGLIAKYAPAAFSPVAAAQTGTVGEERKQKIENALTYQPRTATGQGFTNVAGYVPGKVIGAVEKYGGPYARDVVQGTLLAEGMRSGIRSAPESRAAGSDRYARQEKPAVPTTEQLRSAANEAYKSSADSGVVVPKEGYTSALDSVRGVAKNEGLDPTLHPKSSAVMKRLEEAAGKDLTLQEAETLRKIALDAEDDLNPVTRQPTPDARIAGKIVDQLDESIDALDFNSDARVLWSRMRKSQMVDQMIHRAEVNAGAHYTQAGMEHALRQEFKRLANNERRLRGLNQEQRAAIEKVAKGGPMENTLRALGKFDPTTGPVAAIASLGTGLATGGVLPAAGFLAKRAATRATGRNVDLAREALVGRGAPVVPKTPSLTPQQITASKLSGNLSLGEYTPPPFTPVGGVMPARAAASSGLELQPQGFMGAQVFPPVPSRLSADVLPAPTGGIQFTPSHLPSDIAAQLAGGLDFAKPAARSADSIDFTPPSMAPQMAGDLRLAGETPATPAKASMESLDLPPPIRPPRPSKEILADIQRLSSRVRVTAKKNAQSPEVAKALADLRALQLELEASQAGQ